MNWQERGRNGAEDLHWLATSGILGPQALDGIPKGGVVDWGHGQCFWGGTHQNDWRLEGNELTDAPVMHTCRISHRIL